MQYKDVTPIIAELVRLKNSIPLEIDVGRYLPEVRKNTHGEAVRSGLKKALRVIEQAPAVASMPRWISVEERLPEGEGWVFAIGLLLKRRSKGNYGWCVPHVAEYRHGRWCDSDGMIPDLEDRGLKITHWMPLPEPPKEESTC